jgi:signal peptidase I
MNESKVKRKKIKLLQLTGLMIVIILLVRPFFFSNYVVEGESMMPTLKDGDHLFVNKFELFFGQLKRFDIVVFKGKTDDYVKRVIGLPGDKVEYNDDVLYINNHMVEESFLNPYKQRLIGGNLTGDFNLEEITGELVVPEGFIFVVGDNRLGSWDSRHYGFIRIKNVVGTVDVKYWPIEKIEVEYKK